MITLDEFIKAHKLSCQSRHKENGQFASYPCTCGRDDAVRQLAALRAESKSRRVALEQKSEELRKEWTRAENAEAALDEAIRYVREHPSEDNWDEDFLQKYECQK